MMQNWCRTSWKSWRKHGKTWRHQLRQPTTGMFTCGKCKVWSSKAAIGTAVASVDNLASSVSPAVVNWGQQDHVLPDANKALCFLWFEIWLWLRLVDPKSVSFGEQSIQHHPTSSDSQFLFASFIGESKPKMPRKWNKWNRNGPEMEHIGAQWNLSTVRHQVFRWTHDHLCDLRGSESHQVTTSLRSISAACMLSYAVICCCINC